MDKALQYIEVLPKDEMERRHNMCRTLCQELSPDAGGLLVFSRLNIYYLTGTLGNGILWLPLEGEPVLFLRSALSRAQVESPICRMYLFNDFSDILAICSEHNIQISPKIAVEMGAVPWDMANNLQASFVGHSFINGDMILAKARSRKSVWELNKMRLAGERHHTALYEILPQRLKAGMSEQDVAHISWEVFFGLGHGGINRMGNFGEECFLGHIAAGDNGNYPSHFNGPLGLMGEHPSTPYMGNSKSFWHKGGLLALDIGFMLEGYHTDKTQVYFAGKAKDMPDYVHKAHDACIEIQERASEALKVGAIPSQIWTDAKARAERLGISEGFMGLGKNKVPFLGHGIGLVVDEYPVLASRFDEPLQENMTMAIEPKVGIAGIGMVGVENTFEVTPQGGKSITGHNFSIVCVE